MAGSGRSEQKNVVSEEVTPKKSKTLSSLFSRNGKSGLGKTRSNSTSASRPGSGSNSKTTKSETNDRSGGSNGKSAPVTVEHRTIGQEPLDPWRMPLHIERAVYRLSHVKLMHPRRPLLEQVLISNMMIWYLGIFNQEMQQIQQQQMQQMQQMQQEYPGEISGTDHGVEMSHQYYSQDTSDVSEDQYDYYYSQEDSSEDLRNDQNVSRGKQRSFEDANGHGSTMETFTDNEKVNGAGAESRRRKSEQNARAVRDSEYDEESMIGNRFESNTRWSDEDEEEADEDEDDDSEDDEEDEEEEEDERGEVPMNRSGKGSKSQANQSEGTNVVTNGREGRSLYLRKNTSMDDFSHHLTDASHNSAETAPMPLTQHPAPRSSAKV